MSYLLRLDSNKPRREGEDLRRWSLTKNEIFSVKLCGDFLGEFGVTSSFWKRICFLLCLDSL